MSSNLTRLGGLAAIAAGVLWSVKAFISRNNASPWPTKGTDSLFLIVLPLFLVGLMGLYVRCKGRLGSEGEVAFAVCFVGLITSFAGQVGLLVTKGAWFIFDLGFAATIIGLIALGVAASETKALPRCTVLPSIIGSLGIFSFPGSYPPDKAYMAYIELALWMLFGLSWVLLGYELFSGRDEEPGNPHT